VDYAKSVGQTIREHRLSRRWTVDELAEKSGVSRTTLNRIESGSFSTTLDTLAKLAEAFGLPLPALLSESAEADKPSGAADGITVWEVARHKLHRLRLEKGLTAGEMAALLEMTPERYQEVEAGGAGAGLNVLETACMKFGVPPTYFMPLDEADRLSLDWPDGFRMVARGAKGTAEEREKLKKLFEIAFEERIGE
jgi:transcriptional regulator with XRE-family HTH domain